MIVDLTRDKLIRMSGRSYVSTACRASIVFTLPTICHSQKNTLLTPALQPFESLTQSLAIAYGKGGKNEELECNEEEEVGSAACPSRELMIRSSEERP